jgi:hypothetical protein
LVNALQRIQNWAKFTAIGVLEDDAKVVAQQRTRGATKNNNNGIFLSFYFCILFFI